MSSSPKYRTYTILWKWNITFHTLRTSPAASVMWNIKFIKCTQNKLTVTEYVQNVRLWQEHKHTSMLAIGQLHHQSATAPSCTTHAVDAVAAYRCHELQSYAPVAESQTKWHNPGGFRSNEFLGHMSGAVKSGVVRRSSSIVSLARWTCALDGKSSDVTSCLRHK